MIVAGAMAESLKAGMPWWSTAGLALMAAGAIGAQAATAARWQRVGRWATVAGVLPTWPIPVGSFAVLSVYPNEEAYFGAYFALAGWAAALAISLASLQQTGLALRVRWRGPAVLGAAVVGTFWLVGAYLFNQRGGFYLGLLLNLGWMILSLAWFRLPTPAIQAIVTLILLLVGLPVADQFVTPPVKIEARAGFSYEAWKKNPEVFVQWWDYFVEHCVSLMEEVLVGPDGKRRMPPAPGEVLKVRPAFRLRPNGRARLFDSAVVINSKGFRGREIPAERGQAYRIVALGESTTFGVTMQRSDRPWPEALEELIRQRLKPSRPVEVINGGVPCYDLEDNLARLERDILPLQPDLILSYHGYHGFNLLAPSLPPAFERPPPTYEPRPLNLLAAVEHGVRMRLLRHSRMPASRLDPRLLANVMQTKYGRAYRRLAEVAQAKGIRLVIGNYSMAVNRQSDPDVITFYRLGFPAVDRIILINEAHSRLVQEVARQYPSVCLVDTHPGLDGQHEKFIDLLHFTQPGREQMAENMFAGLREWLEHELANRPEPRPNSR
jgi:hypothetical protein